MRGWRGGSLNSRPLAVDLGCSGPVREQADAGDSPDRPKDRLQHQHGCWHQSFTCGLLLTDRTVAVCCRGPGGRVRMQGQNARELPFERLRLR